MAVRNDITCDILKSKPGSAGDMQRYEDGWERIFGNRMAHAADVKPTIASGSSCTDSGQSNVPIPE